MDYWNADGSLAEMCGNGVRVFARYLRRGRAGRPGRGGAAGGHPGRGGARAWSSGDDDRRRDAPPRVYGAATATVGGLTLPGTAVDVRQPAPGLRLPAELDAGARWT